MTTNDTKLDVDGWCAWHPEKGWLGKDYLYYVRESFEGALEELRESLDDDFLRSRETHYGLLDIDFTKWAKERGWQILPVKLIHAERWKELKEWLSKLIVILNAASYPPPCRNVPISHKTAAELKEELNRILPESDK